jgi:acetoin utilization deacetylase AcuC-like enzyme
METVAIIDDPLFSEHRATEPHPERPERLEAARRAAASIQAPIQRSARDASFDELARVHSSEYVTHLGRLAGKSGRLDSDTYYSERSVAAALRAAGAAIGATELLAGGAANAALALVRPPGHHARPSGAMGFCLLNNVAAAAAAARASGAERVAIVDWDVHHGNGTQEIFYADPSVLYVSLHQFPFYPGTGDIGELGRGEGRGSTVNVPLSAGAGDAVYTAAAERLIAPILEQFDPDQLLVSAGFDAHRRDPLASMELSAWGYARMLQTLLDAMPRGWQGKVALMLEGGYDLVGLEESLRATLGVLAGTRPEQRELGPISPRHAEELARAERALAPHWKL